MLRKIWTTHKRPTGFLSRYPTWAWVVDDFVAIHRPRNYKKGDPDEWLLTHAPSGFSIGFRGGFGLSRESAKLVVKDICATVIETAEGKKVRLVNMTADEIHRYRAEVSLALRDNYLGGIPDDFDEESYLRVLELKK